MRPITRPLIAATRREKGLTQEQLAEAVGLHRNTYATIERGVRTPSLKNAVAISKVLGKSVNELFSDIAQCPQDVQRTSDGRPTDVTRTSQDDF